MTGEPICVSQRLRARIDHYGELKRQNDLNALPVHAARLEQLLNFKSKVRMLIITGCGRWGGRAIPGHLQSGSRPRFKMRQGDQGHGRESNGQGSSIFPYERVRSPTLAYDWQISASASMSTVEVGDRPQPM